MGSKILLADDSITIQKVVNLTFADEGIEVVTVSNGEMAERRLAEINPDLVLADIFMPGRNGYELCQFVKESPQFRNVPVVLLVGAFEPFDQAEAKRVKADDHLTKPFESRTLVETVRRLIQSSKSRPAPSGSLAQQVPVTAQLPPLPTQQNGGHDGAAFAQTSGYAKEAGQELSALGQAGHSFALADQLPPQSPAVPEPEPFAADYNSLWKQSEAESPEPQDLALPSITIQVPEGGHNYDHDVLSASPATDPISIGHEPIAGTAETGGFEFDLMNSTEQAPLRETATFEAPAEFHSGALYADSAAGMTSHHLDISHEAHSAEIPAQPSGEVFDFRFGSADATHSAQTEPVFNETIPMPLSAEPPAGFSETADFHTPEPAKFSSGHELTFATTDAHSAQSHQQEEKLITADLGLPNPEGPHAEAGHLSNSESSAAMQVPVHTDLAEEEPLGDFFAESGPASGLIEEIGHAMTAGEPGHERAEEHSFAIETPAAHAPVEEHADWREHGFGARTAPQMLRVTADLPSASDNGGAVIHSDFEVPGEETGFAFSEPPASAIDIQALTVESEPIALGESAVHSQPEENAGHEEFTAAGMWATEAHFSPVEVESVAPVEPTHTAVAPHEPPAVAPEQHVPSADAQAGIEESGFAIVHSAVVEPPVVQTGTNGATALSATPGAIVLSEETLNEIVRRVVKELSDSVVREVAWEVVPDCVERIVEKLTRENAPKRY